MGEKVLEFYVKGSGKKPYRAAFWKEEGSRDIHSGCNCPAGKRMQYCKHRFQLLEGDITNLEYDLETSQNLELLQEWLKDSDIGEFFTEFMMAKTGERISRMMNAIKFGYSESKYNETIHVWDSEHIKYSTSELKEKYGFEYKEIPLDEFLELLDYSVIVLGNESENHLFNEDRKYFGTYIGRRTKFKGYGLKKLKGYNYTKSEYLSTCYELYKKVNIKEYNQKMKEIMK